MWKQRVTVYVNERVVEEKDFDSQVAADTYGADRDRELNNVHANVRIDIRPVRVS
jgi:hypothetical protein